jgi:cytochrome o ubiquinol oxidase operon protein cyoD
MNAPLNHRTYFEDIGAWPEGPHLVWPAYVLGFIISLMLTFAAYAGAVYHLVPVSMTASIGILAGLAALQFLIQLVFFFHLSAKKSAYERLAVLIGTVVIIGILLSGSIWIMLTLNARMMPNDAQMTQYMNSQPGL